MNSQENIDKLDMIINELSNHVEELTDVQAFKLTQLHKYMRLLLATFVEKSTAKAHDVSKQLEDEKRGIKTITAEQQLVNEVKRRTLNQLSQVGFIGVNPNSAKSMFSQAEMKARNEVRVVDLEISPERIAERMNEFMKNKNKQEGSTDKDI